MTPSRRHPALLPAIALVCAASATAAAERAATSAPVTIAGARASTPAHVIADAPAGAWRAIDPADLLLIDLANGRRVAIELAPRFAPIHVGNIRRLAEAHWYDGLSVSRVQDDYVAQWGDPDETKLLPATIVRPVPAEYERPAAGLALAPLLYRDSFAAKVGFAGDWPVAAQGKTAWLAHCYGMVGVGRDVAPDTGTGAELYAVIGHAPRALDRNIALVGRVIDGIDVLASLPRGTNALGVYATAAERMPIVRVRLAADLPVAERPRFEMLRSESASFAAWVKARANRRDEFFIRPAGAIDLCNAMPPVRAARP